MSAKNVQQASIVGLAVVALVFLPKLVLGESSLYTSMLTTRTVLFIAAPVKLAFLVIAGAYATRCFRFFEPSNPVRFPWALLSVGLLGYSVAQAILAYYQLVAGTATPFPSLADVFFVPATVLLVASLFTFLAVYRNSGFPVAEGKEVVAVILLAAALLVALSIAVVRPVLASDAPVAESALNIAYPVLDCFLLIPAVLLLHTALAMRGGSVARVWMTLLAGFVCLAAGDILFAFFTTLEMASLDPALDFLFAASYILFARATATQYGILTSTA